MNVTTNAAESVLARAQTAFNQTQDTTEAPQDPQKAMIEEAQETVAQTRIEAGKGDPIAIRKLVERAARAFPKEKSEFDMTPPPAPNGEIRGRLLNTVV